MRRGAILLTLAQAACGAGLAGAATPGAPGDCPPAGEVSQRHLLGLWRAQFDGQAGAATLLLEKHPLYAQSVTGAITRDGDKAWLAGDIEDGELTLEESVNGVNISATWSGTVEENSCGTVIKGDWQAAQDPAPRAFVLRKLPASH